jgi:hypothetical protein
MSAYGKKIDMRQIVTANAIVNNLIFNSYIQHRTGKKLPDKVLPFPLSNWSQHQSTERDELLLVNLYPVAML